MGKSNRPATLSAACQFHNYSVEVILKETGDSWVSGQPAYSYRGNMLLWFVYSFGKGWKANS